MIVIPGVHQTVQTQLQQLLQSFLLGVPAGVLLEIFRTLRALLPHHAVTVFIEDTLYSFAICFLLQCYAWMYADGVLRWYHAAGALCGLCVWLITAGAVWARMLFRFRRFRGCIAAGMRRVCAKKTAQQKNISEIT